jgi:hypothetical protein
MSDRVCIITGEDGENPDDCTTHEHESRTYSVTFVADVEAIDTDEAVEVGRQLILDERYEPRSVEISDT